MLRPRAHLQTDQGSQPPVPRGLPHVLRSIKSLPLYRLVLAVAGGSCFRVNSRLLLN
jgi:hypothetical protein